MYIKNWSYFGKKGGLKFGEPKLNNYNSINCHEEKTINIWLKIKELVHFKHSILHN